MHNVMEGDDLVGGHSHFKGDSKKCNARASSGPVGFLALPKGLKDGIKVG